MMPYPSQTISDPANPVYFKTKLAGFFYAVLSVSIQTNTPAIFLPYFGNKAEKNLRYGENQAFLQKELTIMTEDEKKLLQAQHRLEEAQARDRVKELKARTRRLIQEGAILEKVFPTAGGMDLTELEHELERKLN